jgi:hypothetical protein
MSRNAMTVIPRTTGMAVASRRRINPMGVS